MGHLDDIVLVTQVAVLGNKRAFDRLVGKYQSTVRRFLLSQTLGDSQLADDLAQDTFVKAYDHIASFRGASSFSTWLLRIAYNTYYDYRRSHRLTEDVDRASQVLAKASPSGERGMLSIDICHALSLLRAEERACITLQLIEGQPIERIAEIMKMPQGTVKSHLSRGKDKLAKFLRDNGYDG